MKKSNVVAHRGSKGTRPENTLAAFKEALRVKSDGIELDVHLSKDRQLMVIHDETVDRTTNGTGYVKDMTAAELQQLDAGGWFDPRYKGEKIPLLAEVLELLQKEAFTGMLNIELKTDTIPYTGIEELVLAATAPYGSTVHFVYSSFNYHSLEIIKKLHPGAEIACLFKKRNRNQVALTNGIPVEAWHPHLYLVASLLRSKPHSLAIRVWTVNKIWEMLFCYWKQVDAIITDYPQTAIWWRKVLQRK